MPVWPAALTLLVYAWQPVGARDLHNRAVQLEAAGNHAAALALLWEAAGVAPQDAEIQNRLGEALDRLGALDGAIAAFERATAARRDFTTAENNLVLALSKAGRSGEAVARAQARVRATAGDPESYFTLGLAQAEHDVEAAIESFRRVLTLRPDHPLARYNLGLVLKRVDRVRDAIAELERAVSLHPGAEAHHALGGVRFQTGDFAGATASLRAAVTIDPRLRDAWTLLGAVLKASRRYADAVDALRRAVAIDPDAWSARATLASVLQLAGEGAAAEQEAAEAERRRRRWQLEREAAVATAVGIAQLDTGEAERAVRQFERAIEAHEAYAPAHYQLGRALRRLGRLEAAGEAFRRAAQLNPALGAPADDRL